MEITDTSIAEETFGLLSKVVQELTKWGFETDILQFFRLVSESRFPMQNISFLLWLEVIRWYQQGTSTTMRYMNQTKLFWKLGWRLFGGRFIRFMGGFKNQSQIVHGETERGYFNPDSSKLNFAIPSVDILREFCPYGNENSKPRKPGIYTDVMGKAAEVLKDTSVCLTFDGKKIKQGLTAKSGDIDILGFEEGLSLTDRKNELAELLNKLQALSILLSDLNELDNVEEMHETTKNEVLQMLRDLHSTVSKLAQDIRELRTKKEFAKSKFIERGGSEWRHGKFVYVISAIHAHLYDIDCFLKTYMETLMKMCSCIVDLNDANGEFVVRQEVNLTANENYVPLPDGIETDNPRLIKQRSEKWHNIRSKAVITGSTIYKALGLESLKLQKEYFDKVICGVSEKAPSDEQLKNGLDY